MAYDERAVAPGVDLWTSSGAAGEQRILPDGCLDLIFDGARLLVAGPDSMARVHISVSAAPMTGVRLHFGRGPDLLGVPADELRDRAVPLDEVWGTSTARVLTERVADDPASALGAWATSSDPDPFGYRLRALLACGRSVAQAAEVLGWSARQLHRRTLPVFGYGPQHLGRILRLLRAVDASDHGLEWTDVAQRAGFADQAHLVRDVKALTGVTPTQLRRERGATA